MFHDWKYDETKELRSCENCKMSELWDEDEQIWKWFSTEEFMDCEIVCKDQLRDADGYKTSGTATTLKE